MFIQMQETTTTSDALERAWQKVIKDSLEGAGYYSVKVPLKGEGLSAYVGVSRPSGLLDLAFEVSAKSIRTLKLVSESKGFSVELERTENAAGQRVSRISVSLVSSAFLDLFKVLAADVVEHCLACSSEAKAMVSLSLRLEHWRKFSEKTGAEGLAPHEQTGLFGELFFLKSLLDQKISQDVAIGAWRGPYKDNQDFCFGSIAVEVKTVTSNIMHIVKITNARQLDDTGLDELYLFHCGFDRRQGAGVTLPQMVAEVTNCLDETNGSGAVDTFDNLLLEQGYHHSQAHLYLDWGYSERGSDIYIVEKGFPRIVESGLADGVCSVSYEIDLSSASACKVQFDQLIDSISI